MTYGEYLKSQGANDEDIKLLDTPIARKAFDAAQAELTAARAAAKSAADAQAADRAELEKWYQEKQVPAFQTMQNDLIKAQANEAKARAAVLALQKQGLIDVAKDLGYDFTTPVVPPVKEGASALDASKYFTKDDILAIATKESEAIAIMSDIAAEHVYLFGSPLRSARELRAEAVKRNLPLEQVWMEKFGVAKARTDKEAADTKAKEDVMRKQITEQVTAEFASKYANPDTRPLESSRSPFAPRPTVNREKAPWETSLDGENGSNDRVRRATLNAMKSQGVH